MNKEAENILKFLQFSQKLKSQERTIKISEYRRESVADHSWHLALMAMVVAQHLEESVDLSKVLKMILIHDLVEAEIGDVPYGDTVRDENIKSEKFRREENEIDKIRKMVKGRLGEEIHCLWHEFEKGETAEARFVKAVDSLEANHQSILHEVSYWDDWFYPIALTKADKHCHHEKILFELNAEITRRMKMEFDKAGIVLEDVK